jgi:hypothetical protein
MFGPTRFEDVDSVRRRKEGASEVGALLLSVSLVGLTGTVAARAMGRGGGVVGEGEWRGSSTGVIVLGISVVTVILASSLVWLMRGSEIGFRRKEKDLKKGIAFVAEKVRVFHSKQPHVAWWSADGALFRIARDNEGVEYVRRWTREVGMFIQSLGRVDVVAMWSRRWRNRENDPGVGIRWTQIDQ